MKRIIICDSGLGGLNIAGHFFSVTDDSAEPCELIYFNAYPEKGRGFNTLPDQRAQEEQFRSALEGMIPFAPDRCLIACNTLSIVWERLRAWWQPPFPVSGIVESAVNAMIEAMKAEMAASRSAESDEAGMMSSQRVFQALRPTSREQSSESSDGSRPLSS